MKQGEINPLMIPVIITVICLITILGVTYLVSESKKTNDYWNGNSNLGGNAFITGNLKNDVCMMSCGDIYQEVYCAPGNGCACSCETGCYCKGDFN